MILIYTKVNILAVNKNNIKGMLFLKKYIVIGVVAISFIYSSIINNHTEISQAQTEKSNKSNLDVENIINQIKEKQKKINPKQEIIDYINYVCDKKGLPRQIGLAIAWTESDMTQFNKNNNTYFNKNKDGSTDWGIMQINDVAWKNDFNFDRIKSDWKYNIEIGLSIAIVNYNKAVKSNEENIIKATHSGYNAGEGFIWRYRFTKQEAPNKNCYGELVNGYDIRDINFWNNYINSPWEVK
jgi:hypothetical protein